MTTTSGKCVLLLRVTQDVCQEEVEQLRAIARMLGMELSEEVVPPDRDLQSCLGAERKYDYVYLYAHANVDEFGELQGMPAFRWEELGVALCRGRCLKPGAVLLLAGCRTGIWQVASKLFTACAEIEFVCGPRWTLRPADMVVGFHVFLYNLERREEQPSRAAERASSATGYDFFCYDRLEVEKRLAREAFERGMEKFLEQLHREAQERAVPAAPETRAVPTPAGSS